MNILYIHTHDTGRFIEPYGYGVKTPDLMEFAKRGTLFRSAFCAAPTCSPSRAAQLTGQYPHSCGMLGLAHRGFSMQDYSRHMASYFRRHGYETVLCGIQHEAPEASQIGYSRILDGQEFDMGHLEFDSRTFDLDNARRVCDYLETEHREPFFLSFGMFSTHREYPEPDPETAPEYVMTMPGIPDNAGTRADTASYLAAARTADTAAGEVLRTLERTGLSEDTAVIFTTDHGLALPGMKCTLYDRGTAVALILDYPGNPSRGKVIDALISQIDISPTLCELCGIEKPSWLQGRSFLPVLEGRADKIREEVFAEVTFHAAYEPMRSIRTERYKLIRRYEEELSVVLSNIDDSPAKAFLLEQGCFCGRYAAVELYDLYQDPMEQRNLADHPGYQKQRLELEKRLENWQKETKDPLLAGIVEAPAGAYVNKRTDQSAKIKTAEGSHL